MRLLTCYEFLLAVPIVFAQNVTVPSTCPSKFSPGSDTVLYTVPYTYDQVLSIIGNFQNITWMGVPADGVTLNGTTNTPGTARTYDLVGAHVIETITYYSKPPAPGPYQEIHNTALLTIPSMNVSFSISYDGTIVSSVCHGKASQFNFTAVFCGTNAAATAQILHSIHQTAAMTVGKFLGGQNYTDCAALGVSNSSGPANATAVVPNATLSGASGATPSATVAGSNHAVKYAAGPLAGAVAIFAGVLML